MQQSKIMCLLTKEIPNVRVSNFGICNRLTKVLDVIDTVVLRGWDAGTDRLRPTRHKVTCRGD